MDAGYDKITAERFFRASKELRQKQTKSSFLRYCHLHNFPFKGKRILDAGCGWGYATNFFHGCGAEVYGMDSSRSIIEIARREHPHLVEKFTIGSLQKTLPYKNDFFDLIFSEFVLQYLALPDAAYENFFRCLKQGGYLVAIVRHPFFRFFSKRSKDYFEKEPVKTRVLGAATTITYAHPISSYLSSYFLSHFTLEHFQEIDDGSLYKGYSLPGYFLLHARKR